MKFEWDEHKRIENLHKHGVDFAEASEMFDGVMGISLDERVEYGEDRWIGLGLSRGRILVVAFTEPSADTIHVISLRKANKNERIRYEQAFKDRLGED